MKETIILDTCCLFCYFQSEIGYEAVEELFLKARNKQITLVMSRVNYCEVLYQLKRDKDYKIFRVMVDSLPFNILDTNEKICEIASDIKSKGKISLGDSFAIGTAVFLNGKVATTDRHEFSAFENDVDIMWIR